MRPKDVATAVAAVVAVLALVFAAEVLAQDDSVQREDQLKAAYLFNFFKFIEWPNAQRPGLTVCFVGAKGVYAALSAGIENKRVGTRRLYVRAIEPTARLMVSGCDVLYLDSIVMSSKLTLPPIEDPLLTVSDLPDFTRNGGIIELFNESNRLRFRINVDNAQRAGLRISSNLLQLAADVEKGGSR